jgi:hypothetical protein
MFCFYGSVQEVTKYMSFQICRILHGLYFSPSIVTVIRPRNMRWAGHVARMGEVRGAYNILVCLV